jgi:hypothetical protein
MTVIGRAGYCCAETAVGCASSRAKTASADLRLIAFPPIRHALDGEHATLRDIVSQPDAAVQLHRGRLP